jgi:hypothetical protein
MADDFAHVQQSSAKVPPTLTEGTITPEILHCWERAAINYFRHRKIQPDEQVEEILFEIKDLRLARWIEANESTLKPMPSATFMAELRTEALEPTWTRTLRTQILHIRQGDHAFFNWVCEVESKNAILTSTSSAQISDQQLHDHFETQMDDALAVRCQNTAIISTTDYRSWINAVKQEDKLLRQELQNAHSVSLNILATNNRSTPSSFTRAPLHPSTAPNTSSTANFPKLTEEEKSILNDHNGCFKCRRPYAGHRTRECTNGFPTKHERVTTAMAEAVRDQRNRPRHIAAVLGGRRRDDELPSAVLGTGSGESDTDGSF